MIKILKYMWLKSSEFQLSYMFLLSFFNNINVKELFYIFDDNINDYRYRRTWFCSWGVKTSGVPDTPREDRLYTL